MNTPESASEQPTAMPSDRCPFCNARKAPDRIPGEKWWYCGTYLPVASEDYRTGDKCDKTVFRRGFLASNSALRELVDAIEELSGCQLNSRVSEALRNAEAVFAKHGSP